MSTSSISPLPAGVVDAAHGAIKVYLDRGLKNPQALTSTCHQLAVVILSKWDIADKKMLRRVTNYMVDLAHTDAFEDRPYNEAEDSEIKNWVKSE